MLADAKHTLLMHLSDKADFLPSHENSFPTSSPSRNTH